MNRTQFESLSNEDKIKYINEKLSDGDTVTRIREDLMINEKAWQKLIKSLGFKFDQKSKTYVKEHTLSIHSSNDNVIDDINHTFSIHNSNFNDIMEIISMKEDLKEIIKHYKEVYDKEHTSIIEIIKDEGIKIDLPNSEIVRTTVRVNKEILEIWDTFCSKHKEFSKTNLLSSAMKDYVERYKNT